jgi:hypothetical protein
VEVRGHKQEVYVGSLQRKYDQMRQNKPTVLPHDFLGTWQKKTQAIMNVNKVFSTSIEISELDEDSTLRVPSKKPTSPEVIARAIRGWEQVRGVVNYLQYLYFPHQRRSNAIACVRTYLLEMTEWSRLKHAMKSMLRSIKLMQHTCREFLARRDRRVAMMIKDWQRTEDAYLQAYFKIYAAQAMEDHHKSSQPSIRPKNDEELQQFSAHVQKSASQALALKIPGKKKGEGILSREETDTLAERVVDWRSYRIPARDRRAVVIRYYMINLLRRVRSQQSFSSAVHRMIQWNRESMHFLQSLGADPTKSNAPAFDSNLFPLPEQNAEFWHFPDEVILDTIVVCAQALQKREPFNEHPANKSQVLREECFDRFCRVPKRLASDTRTALQSEIKDGIRHEEKFRRRRSVNPRVARAEILHVVDDESVPRAMDLDNMRRIKAAPADLDEILKRFTPRLIDIMTGNHEYNADKAIENHASPLPPTMSGLCV